MGSGVFVLSNWKVVASESCRMTTGCYGADSHKLLRIRKARHEMEQRGARAPPLKKRLPTPFLVTREANAALLNELKVICITSLRGRP
jgi:hypothetical protein